LIGTPVTLAADTPGPDSTAAQLETALELLKTGREVEGLLSLQELVRRHPSFANAHFYLGLFYTEIEQPDIARGYLKRALSLNPEVGAYHNQLGIVLAAEQSYQSAIDSFMLALKYLPHAQHAAVWENIAEMHLRLAQRDKAIEALEQVLALKPEAVAPRITLGQILLEQNRTDEALEQLIAATEDKASNTDAYLALGMAYMRRNEPELALPIVQRAASTAPGNAQAAYTLAQVLRQLGQQEAATAELARYQQLQRQSEARETRARRLTSAVSTASELIGRQRYAEARDLLEEFAADQQEHPAVLQVLGYLRLIHGQYAAASEALERALVLDKLNPETLFYLGHTYFLAGELERAETVTERAIAIYPWDSRYLAQLGYIQLDGEQHAAARETLEHALELDPASLAARLGLGSLALRTGRLDDAESELTAAVAISADNAEARRLLGLTFWQQRRFADAVDQYEEQVRLLPQAEYSHRILIDTLLILDENALAETAIRRWQSTIPESRLAAYYFGDLLHSTGRYEAAASEFGAALEFAGEDPADDVINVRLGQIYSALNRIDEAIEFYLRAQAISPASTASYGALGNLYLMRNMNEAAAAQFTTVVARDPQHAQGHASLAQAYLRLGRYPEVVDAAQAALQLDDGLNEARYTMAQALRRLGRNAEAREAIQEFQRQQTAQQSLEHRSRERTALVQEAMSVIEKGDYEPAVVLLQDAVRFDPQKGFPYVRLGLAQSLAGKHEEAVQSLQRALELEPGAPDLYRLLADEYRYLGNDEMSDKLRTEYLRGVERKAGSGDLGTKSSPADVSSGGRE
jgi:tetratricopeptide (TPR) repeat protein